MLNPVHPARRGVRATFAVALGTTLVASAAAFAPTATAAAGATFVVNSTLDSADAKADGVCATSAGDCTLRAAIMEANKNSGSAIINFNIPGSGVQTIAPATKLPALTNVAGITINGYSQPGASANTNALVSNAQIKIELKGKGPGTFDGIAISTPNNVVTGLSIYNFWKQISLMGDPADNNRIVGNFVCTNAAGTFGTTTVNALSLGILLQQGPSGNRIGTPALADRNVISGCGNRGVTLSFAPTTGNYVQNNVIGLTPDGTAARPYSNIVGGLNANEGNVLSGNWGSGIEVSHGRNTNSNLVLGNKIGSAAEGTVASYAANSLWGIRFEGPKFCGDPTHENPGGCTESSVTEGLPHDNTAMGNLVLSNKKGGVLIDKGHHHVLLQNNYIGVTPAGVLGGNAIAGIQLQRGVYGTMIKQNTIALMRIIFGVLEPDAGEVWWRGRPATADDRRRFWRDGLGHDVRRLQGRGLRGRQQARPDGQDLPGHGHGQLLRRVERVDGPAGEQAHHRDHDGRDRQHLDLCDSSPDQGLTWQLTVIGSDAPGSSANRGHRDVRGEATPPPPAHKENSSHEHHAHLRSDRSRQRRFVARRRGLLLDLGLRHLHQRREHGRRIELLLRCQLHLGKRVDLVLLGVRKLERIGVVLVERLGQAAEASEDAERRRRTTRRGRGIRRLCLRCRQLRLDRARGGRDRQSQARRLRVLRQARGPCRGPERQPAALRVRSLHPRQADRAEGQEHVQGSRQGKQGRHRRQGRQDRLDAGSFGCRVHPHGQVEREALDARLPDAGLKARGVDIAA